MKNSKRIGLRVASIIAIPAVVATLGVKAIAQEQPGVSEAKNECAAVHLVLVNGTFDTSAAESSTKDHGFGSQIAGKAMRKANDIQPEDPSAGISLENEPATPQHGDAASGQGWEDAPESGGQGTASNDLWGDTPTENTSNDLWGDTPTDSSTESMSTDELWGDTPSDSSTGSLSTDELWGDAPSPSEIPEDEGWQVDEGEDLDRDGVKMARTYVTYPAAAGGAFVPGLPTAESIPYKESMYEGAINTAKVLTQIANQCPDTKVFLAGHSQGAQVVSTVAREIGNGASDFPADKVAGVALFSDPTRDKAVPVMQGGSDTPGATPGTSGENVRQVGPFVSPEQANLDGAGMGVNHGGKDFGVLSDRVASWCADGDLVCDLPISGELSQLVIGTAERLDLDDPEASLRAVGDTLGPAVQLGGVDDIEDGEISFGEGGFEAQAVSAESDGSLMGQIASSGTTSTVKKGSLIGGLGKAVISAVGKIGGMVLNTGIAVVKRALTIENIAQVVLAGVRNPQLGFAVAVGKLASAAQEVVTPEYVSARAQEVMNEVDVMGITGEGLTEVAAQAAGHGAAHNAYGTRPMTEDGRTAIDATVDWVVAAARDSAGDGAVPLEVTQVYPVSDYNAEAAAKAIEEIKNWKAAV
ncbi:MAG: cutinase family protein [Corynebacterium sp.]|uniref:cutinase family protein n=1 Tax=Corynebacterium sp. TaxID=1720 RepID=UPI00264782FB|nr:cutinase family protein [Corynebacterium sp.]MDN6154694.1 cutinase family protein [Corynebacterium casei]MDN6737485.1 cutinase family protein [Corynebacterium sp.]